MRVEISTAHKTYIIYMYIRGGRVGGTTTCCGQDDPGIESRWGRNFLHPSRPALRPTHNEELPENKC